MYFNLGGKYKLALKMTIVLMFAGPWASVLFEYFSQSGDFIPMIYVIIPIQIAALFISTRAMFVIAAAQTIILGIMIMTNPSHSAYNWESILCYIYLASTLGTITSYVLRKQYLNMLSSKNDLAESEKRLRDVSIRDPLSGLYNRRYMDETFHLLAQNPSRVYSLMMVDVDHFKTINDTYGHSCGDVIIQKVADILSASIRKNDVACRYGGDEFLLILADCGLEDSLNKADKIMHAIENVTDGLDLDDNVFITASIGLAQFPENGNNRDGILKAVDDALYTAKQSGRNRIVAASGRYNAVGKVMREHHDANEGL